MANFASFQFRFGDFYNFLLGALFYAFLEWGRGPLDCENQSKLGKSIFCIIDAQMLKLINIYEHLSTLLILLGTHALKIK